MQKGFLLILIALAVAIGGYFLYQQKTKSTPATPLIQTAAQVSPKSDETANWKTYTNGVYSFSFKYPQNWKVDMDQPNIIYIDSPTNFALIIRYKPKGDSLNIVRSGVGAGDLISSGTVSFGSQTINKYLLVFENKNKGILYEKSNEISFDNLVFSLNVDNLRSANADYPTLDKQTEDQIDQILSTFKFTDQNQANDTASWKTFTTSGINTGLTLKYPLNWVTPENMFISEKTFVAGEQDRSKVYNIIEIQKYSTQLYVGYTNSEWFNKISNLTQPMSDQRETRTKITSGNVASGEPYVIFKDEPSATAQGGAFKQVKAYILKGQTIYQLTLDLFDSNGLEIFKSIVATSAVN